MSADDAPRTWVLYFDGDDVGANIELRLLEDDIEGAAGISRSVVRAVGELADTIQTTMSGTVVFAAGDEVLAVVARRPSLDSVEDLRAAFHSETGVTVSCGLGNTASEAARNLHYAKLLGKDRVHGGLGG